jgi:hypothetical protein
MREASSIRVPVIGHRANSASITGYILAHADQHANWNASFHYPGQISPEPGDIPVPHVERLGTWSSQSSNPRVASRVEGSRVAEMQGSAVGYFGNLMHAELIPRIHPAHCVQY